MTLYEKTFSRIEDEKLPTLRQYVKGKTGKAMPKRFLVTKVWYPNKYPSYGIETEHFRATVGETTPLGNLITENLETLQSSEKATFLSISLEDPKKPAMKFLPGTNKGHWEGIGSETPVGIRWLSA